MPDYRVHYSSETAAARELILSPQESHHLIVVNRAQAGATVVAFNGHGIEWETKLTKADKRAARLLVQTTRTSPPLSYEIDLAQALPKGALMDSIVQKATELGVRRILPLVSEHSQVHLDGARQERKVEKWRTTALEAAKQCGNPWLPEIAPVQEIISFLRSTPSYEVALIASLHVGTRPLKTVLATFRERHGRMPRRAVWLIGPEGDFSPSELAAAEAAGFSPVTLGPLVLRCETAAIVAIGILSHELRAY